MVTQFAKSQFYLQTKCGEITLRQHFEQFQKQGIRVPELEARLPYYLLYLWAYFLELHGSRTYGQMTVNPLTYQDILAWQQLTGIRLARWELLTIKGIDQEFMASIYKQTDKGLQKEPNRSK